jgi:hypothetical protein
MNVHISIVTEAHHTARSSWEEALANRDAAKRAYDHYHTTVWLPLADELDRISPRPDLSFEIEARSGQVARYLVPANDLHAWDDHWSPVFRQKAAAVREAWLAYRADCERLGWDAACDESERLCNIQCVLESSLILMPAPDQTALMWKLEHLFGPETRKPEDYCDAWCAEWINAVMDDAGRLLAPSDGPLFAWATKTVAA